MTKREIYRETQRLLAISFVRSDITGKTHPASPAHGQMQNEHRRL
jgi:hypothetical protein